jgi:hypothetical protein
MYCLSVFDYRLSICICCLTLIFSQLSRCWFTARRMETSWAYSQFSGRLRHVEAVREYIRDQPEHHQQEDFQAEFRRLCEKNRKPLAERSAED